MGGYIDQIYRSILQTKFFVHGWGKPENLRQIFAFRKILSDREHCMKLVDKNYPITITKKVDHKDHYTIEAEFTSPLVDHLPGLLPKESEKAYFQMIIPKQWKTQLKPTCLHLAGTGDHGFWRRRVLMAKPLMYESGIASIIHENPFYGLRKPNDQRRSSLRNVSDLFLMGGSLVLESMAIFHWAERQGLGPLGITGISMGGHMASLAACSWDKPIPLIPCLSWSTASGVFTQGVLSGAINWEKLKNQYFSDEVFRDELFNMIHSPEGYFRVYHEVGQQFAREFPKSLSHVEKLQTELGTKSKRNLGTKDSTNGAQSIFNPLRLLGTIQRKKWGVSTVSSYRDAKKNISNPHHISHRKQTSQTPSHRTDSFHPVVIRPATAASSNLPPVTFKPYVNVRDSLTWEALQFMRGIMDECTHIGNFCVPVDPSLVIIVAANDDAYMPRNGVIPLNELWPGSELRTLNTGHILAFLFSQQVFRRAIEDAFERTIKKYYSHPIPIHSSSEESSRSDQTQSSHSQHAHISSNL